LCSPALGVPGAEMTADSPFNAYYVVAVIAIVVIVAGIASYIVLTRPAGTTCTLSSKDPLIFDQPETPDTLIPTSRSRRPVGA